MASSPTSDIDPFEAGALADPYGYYAEMHRAGGVVWLEKYGLWAVAGYAAVRQALLDWETFSSDKAIAIAPEFNEMLGINIIGSDPPVHDIMRKAMAAQMTPRAIRRWNETFITAAADRLIAELARKGSFETVRDLAQPFPLEIVSDLIGLPKSGRERILEIARASFNLTGPNNDRAKASLSVMADAAEFVANNVTPEHLAPGGLAMSVYTAAASGKLPQEYAMPVILAYLFPAMDTTINAIINAVWLFGRNPAQWQALRAEPSLINSAFEEVLRFESPVLGFARKATRDIALGNAQIRKGDQVYLMYGAANRDEARYADAARFDIRRNPVDNVAFGYGIHHCMGQGLARAEGRAVLTAMVRHFAEIHIGEPTRVYSNGVRGLASLPARVVAAQA